MSGQTYTIWNDAVASHQKLVIELAYEITGAKTGAFLNPKPQVIAGYDAADFTQAACDALLGSTSEFVTATAYGSTALGTDAMGIILNLGSGVAGSSQGQAALTADCWLEVTANLAAVATYSAIVKGQTTALPNTLAAPARMQIGASGNVAIQFVLSGLDAATAGMLLFKLHIQAK